MKPETNIEQLPWRNRCEQRKPARVCDSDHRSGKIRDGRDVERLRDDESQQLHVRTGSASKRVLMLVPDSLMSSPYTCNESVTSLL